MTLNSIQSYIWTNFVLDGLRRTLAEQEFVEILPALLSAHAEPGARHTIAVMGHRRRPAIQVASHELDPNHRVAVVGERAYYLPVSHCVEKQLALESLDRVYCLAPCIRLLMEGEHDSSRHLYTFFQVEVEWRSTDLEEVFQTAEAVFSGFASLLLAAPPPDRGAGHEYRRRLEGLAATPYERLTFLQARQEARAAVEGLGWVNTAANPHSMLDLTLTEEAALTRSRSAPFWIHDYPEGVRDCPFRRNERGFYDTYDLMLPFGHGELATGGLRPESAAEIVRQSALLGKEVNGSYAAWKDRTGVQSAGFGIGLERLVKYCAGWASVLDARRPHDSGPNTTIEAERSQWS
jgi:asparaginyl-tRNA synthetase